MAGSYCNFCDRRCFVYREVIVGGELVWAGHMATCERGRAHSKQVHGVDFTQAHNPHAPASEADSSGATAPAPQRVWIDAGGMVLCDRHAGNYLRSGIERAPHARRHETPRGDWLADESGACRCELCDNS